MVKKYTKTGISQDLDLLMLKLKDQANIDVDTLLEAINTSHQLTKKIFTEAKAEHDEEFKQFIHKSLEIIEDLKDIATQEYAAAPEPSVLFAKLDSAFQNFTNRALSKENKKSLRNLVEHVKFVNNVIYCCETLPYYWSYATKAEKLALVLSATLMVISLALVIAAFINPLFLIVPVLSTILFDYPVLGVGLYKTTIERLKDRNKKFIDIKEGIKVLNQQQKDLANLVNEIKERKLPHEPMLITSKRKGSDHQPGDNLEFYMKKNPSPDNTKK